EIDGVRCPAKCCRAALGCEYTVSQCNPVRFVALEIGCLPQSARRGEKVKNVGVGWVRKNCTCTSAVRDRAQYAILDVVALEGTDIEPLWYSRRSGSARQQLRIERTLLRRLDEHVTYERRIGAASLPVGFQAEKGVIGIVGSGGPVMIQKINAGVSGIVRIRAGWGRGIR